MTVDSTKAAAPDITGRDRYILAKSLILAALLVDVAPAEQRDGDEASDMRAIARYILGDSYELWAAFYAPDDEAEEATAAVASR
jgi:hypothetical protein